MRQASRTDANQAAIVAAFRALGCTVQPLHAVGHGCPDILVGVSGLNLAVEIKDGSKPPSARRRTPQQVDWHEGWTGSVDVVTSEAEAVQLVADTRRMAAALRDAWPWPNPL